jgi:hypothetical protein
MGRLVPIVSIICRDLVPLSGHCNCIARYPSSPVVPVTIALAVTRPRPRQVSQDFDHSRLDTEVAALDKNSKLLPQIALFAMKALACDSGDTCEPHTVLDRALVSPSPERFQDMSTCTPRKFDLTTAVKADGSLPLAWLVAYEQGSGSPPDAINALSPSCVGETSRRVLRAGPKHVAHFRLFNQWVRVRAQRLSQILS